MRDFGEFHASLQHVWNTALVLQERTPSDLHESDWSSVKAIFCGIRCMASGTSLVGNSKVMAHLIPALVPPAKRGRGHVSDSMFQRYSILTMDDLRSAFTQTEQYRATEQAKVLSIAAQK
jgi:hypothetical protein